MPSTSQSCKYPPMPKAVGVRTGQSQGLQVGAGGVEMEKSCTERAEEVGVRLGGSDTQKWMWEELISNSFPHFTDGETDVQRGRATLFMKSHIKSVQGHAGQGSEPGWRSGGLVPSPYVTEDSLSIHCLWQSGFANRLDQIPALLISLSPWAGYSHFPSVSSWVK